MRVGIGEAIVGTPLSRGPRVGFNSGMRTRPIVTLAMVLAAPPAAAEGFLTLDRGDGESRAGAELSYLTYDNPFLDDITVLRFEGHGHYVSPSGLGGYGAMQISYGWNDDESGTGIADAELGMLYVRRMNPSTELVFRAGLTLPTGNGDDDVNDLLVNVFGATARITDTIQAIPEGVTLRLAASPVFKQGQFFARLDGGLDINISNAGPNEPDPVLRINLGAGVDLGAAAITGEIANLISTDGDLDDQTSSSFALAVRGKAGGVQPYAGVVLPLGDEYEGVDFVLTAGVDASLGGGTPR
jgi:hypothetical protein